MEQVPKHTGPEASLPKTKSDSALTYSTIASPNPKPIPAYQLVGIGSHIFNAPGTGAFPNDRTPYPNQLRSASKTTTFPGPSTFSIRSDKMSLTATATATSALPCPPSRVHTHARSQSQSSGPFPPKAAATRVPGTPPASVA